MVVQCRKFSKNDVLRHLSVIKSDIYLQFRLFRAHNLVVLRQAVQKAISAAVGINLYTVMS